jgi:hypothetical protein
MNDNRPAEAIIRRLSRLRALESQLIDRLEWLRTASASDRIGGENFARLSALAASHRRALEGVAGLRGAELNHLEATGFRTRRRAICADGRGDVARTRRP